VAWVEDNYQVSVKYQTLHKQVRYGMKAKLKVPRCCSNKKDASAAIELKTTKKFAQNSFVVRVYYPRCSKKRN